MLLWFVWCSRFIGLQKDKSTYEGVTAVFHQDVLQHFVETFNFRQQSLLSCLRMFLASFRLPGEAQQIDRILQVSRSKKSWRSCLIDFLLAGICP